jgi:hypothetical protein
MGIQELDAIIAEYRARRERLRRVDTSGMDEVELHQHLESLGYAKAVISLAEQLRERRILKSSADPRDHEQYVRTE